MIQETLSVGPLQCNCMILGCETTNECVVIDPGDEAPRIIRAIEARGLIPKYLLHTHAHFDHVCGTKGVRERFEAPTCLHAGDLMLYRNVPMQGRLFGMSLEDAPALEKTIEDGEIIPFGEHALEVIHTPGHSPGSVSFVLKGSSPVIYSGDTLFYRSVGRADLWGGDERQLVRSIRERLFVLDDSLPVYPGHGPSTVLGQEKRENPFLS